MNKDKILDFFELTDSINSYKELVTNYKDKTISENVFKNKVIDLIKENTSFDDEVLHYFNYIDIFKEKILQNNLYNKTQSVLNPSHLPNPSSIKYFYEPYINLDVITPEEYLGKIIELINTCRGEVKEINSISLNQLKISTLIPLSEVIVNFYDELKSITKGYASMNYEFADYIKGDLVKLDILLNGNVINPLSMIKHKQNIESYARKICERLKELIPRQQIEVVIQAAIGAKIIARETIKPFRKDVTANLYGGDISRRKKLLEKQKEGKKRMKTFGSVNVPKEVFVNILQN
jgi:GTP-binding protein LepA